MTIDSSLKIFLRCLVIGDGSGVGKGAGAGYVNGKAPYSGGVGTSFVTNLKSPHSPAINYSRGLGKATSHSGNAPGTGYARGVGVGKGQGFTMIDSNLESEYE